ncbi:hypothetical protein [Paenibacillus larvae]|uniref:hypothetical protein n=1 Tax=Paenibacillus larvae TaxID=1464 RepID=UPI00288D5454|nr:hypothetical protein [Paenibacillus larvae]MDT2194151.1 hypothetical protein [Paenibacillus larvae]
MSEEKSIPQIKEDGTPVFRWIGGTGDGEERDDSGQSYAEAAVSHNREIERNSIPDPWGSGTLVKTLYPGRMQISSLRKIPFIFLKEPFLLFIRQHQLSLSFFGKYTWTVRKRRYCILPGA